MQMKMGAHKIIRLIGIGIMAWVVAAMAIDKLSHELAELLVLMLIPAGALIIYHVAHRGLGSTWNDRK